ncbi:MAG: glycosyltransferase family 2 protein [Chloroflexi bacterium]|nr:glycosyltransferase family 2 protein [Chloroflexota bacterium]
MIEPNSSPPVISIVAPVYNEEAILHELYRRMAETLDAIGETWELVLVNDGSYDRSFEIMCELHEQDARVHVVNFSRNFGHQIAITAGADYAQGEAVVVIDADLQDPPSLIGEMVQKWREGYEVIYAVRAQRKGETRFKLWTASLFYHLINRITGVDIPRDAGDFRLMDRKVVDAMRRMREHHRFMRGLSVWVGFKQIGVEYIREERYAGETKYPFSKMLRFALDGITSFSYLPLQLATYLGFFIAGLSVLGILFTVILRLSGSQAFFGQASTLVIVLFLGGIQLISLGIIGEYLGRIYEEVKQRPLYIVSDAIGFREGGDGS